MSAMMGFFFYLTIIAFIFVCLILILLILIQKGRGGGLASAFGGAGGNTAFGSKTGDVLTWTTSVVFGVFLLLAVALNLVAEARNRVFTTSQASESSIPRRTTPATPELPIRSSPMPVAPTRLPDTVPATVPAAPSTAATGPATQAAPSPPPATTPATPTPGSTPASTPAAPDTPVEK
jgi:preprotein translocase subunit SecG